MKSAFALADRGAECAPRPSRARLSVHLRCSKSTTIALPTVNGFEEGA